MAMKSLFVLCVGATCLLLSSCAGMGVSGAFDATSPIKPPAGHAASEMDHQIDLSRLLAYEISIHPANPAVQFQDKDPPQQPDIAKDISVSKPDLYIGTSPDNIDPLIAAVGQNGDRKFIRNDVVSALISASTANCYAYLKNLRGDQVSSRLLFDALSGGFATAGSLVVPTQTAHLLGGLSAFSTAEGSSFDRNIFAQQAAEAVGDAILQLRAEDLTKINHSMTLPYNEWPLGLALADVMAFHGDCSVTRGLTQMQGAIQQREVEINVVRQAVLNADTTTAPALLKILGAMIVPEQTATEEPTNPPINSTKDTAPAAKLTPPASLDDASVKAAADIARIQLALHNVAHDILLVDGKLGPTTKAALIAYQKSQAPKLVVSGVADAATKTALGVVEPADAAAQAVDAAAVNKVKAFLHMQHFPVPISPSAGKATGIIDAPTVAAIVVYQSTVRLPETGILDKATLGSMKLST